MDRDSDVGEELEGLILCGIPDHHRSTMWPLLVHRWVKHERNPLPVDYYASISHRTGGPVPPEQIELDLQRTFPFNKFFLGRNSRGIVKLRRILRAFTRHCPKIGYCQGFNFIAGFALLFLPEEEAFW